MGSQPVVSTTGKATVNPSVGGIVGVGNRVTVEIPVNALNSNNAERVIVEKVSQPPAVGGNFTPSICYYDEDSSRWVSIGGKVLEDTITAEVDHFTKFAVLAIKDVTGLKDIKGHWAENSIVELIDMGAIGGYPDGTFRPEDNITRAEFTKILVQSFNLTPQNGKVFKDTMNHWAKEDIATASYYEIINGYDDDRFGANDYLTREQMAAIIVNAVKVELVSQENSFVDHTDVSAWAKNAVNTAVREGIISGYPDGSFKPKSLATRAETVAVIMKALK